MNKKASSIIMMIFEILVVITVVSIAFQVATSYAKNEVIIKVNLAEDFSMMVDTLVALPDDALVIYPQTNLSKYLFLLNSDYVLVMLQNDSAVQRVYRKIHLPEGFNAYGKAEYEERICLEKKNKIIVLRSCKIEETKK